MTELELEDLTRRFDARYKPVIREATAIAVNHYAIVCALMETHPDPHIAMAAARRHIEAQTVNVLYSCMEDYQAQRIVETGEQMLQRLCAVIASASGNRSARTAASSTQAVSLRYAETTIHKETGVTTEPAGFIAVQLAQLRVIVDILVKQLCMLDHHQRPELLKALYAARQCFTETDQSTECIDSVMAFVAHDGCRAAPQ